MAIAVVKAGYWAFIFNANPKVQGNAENNLHGNGAQIFHEKLVAGGEVIRAGAYARVLLYQTLWP